MPLDDLDFWIMQAIKYTQKRSETIEESLEE
jgi:hypothetical protein